LAFTGARAAARSPDPVRAGALKRRPLNVLLHQRRAVFRKKSPPAALMKQLM
jgi:hypothetical protein